MPKPNSRPPRRRYDNRPGRAAVRGPYGQVPLPALPVQLAPGALKRANERG